MLDRATAALAVADSARRGYLDGRALAGVFAWLRPNDLVWNYWVSNYLLGKDPPAFDILFWNADTTNMPAGLHRDFVRLALENALVEPGALPRAGHAGRPLARSPSTPTWWRHRRPHHAVAELLPQRARCSARARASCSPPAATSRRMVNPPDNPKATFRVNDALPGRPGRLARGATPAPGQLVGGLDRRGWRSARAASATRPRRSAAQGHPPLGRAPGTYVRE